MGALRRVLHRRILAAICASGAAVAGVAACEPVAGGLNSVAVAVTTDRTGTSTLERIGFHVRWLSCTANVDGGKAGATASASPSRPSVATVDCQGETESGQKITLKGKVTDERSGKCVRGDLVGKVDGKVVFEASVLGNCNAAPSSTPATRTPGGPSRPTVTVTVTVTADPPGK
ncbi:hypothetical protein [Streptomyces sp. NPDC005408]|uniref:hypothetical protein n=1 Tax=Streptomyces sp. NPDC005408 TaxID=3155341 RepID=UPI0033A30670